MNAKSLLQLALLCTVAAYFKPSFHRKENGYFVRFFGEDDSVAGIRDGNEDIVVDSLEVIERQQNVLVRQPLHVSHKIVDNSSEQQNNSKLFGLPELSDFLRDEKRSKSNRGSKARRNKRTTERNAVPKVNRKNQEDYTKVLQLNPFADADNEIFVEEYDIFQSVFGMGTILRIPVPYLQSGHLMLLFVSTLAALVYAPGNPLTEFPLEVRVFLQQGLQIILSINLVLAVQAFFSAKHTQKQSGLFWFAKVLFLGGIASYELSELIKKLKQTPLA